MSEQDEQQEIAAVRIRYEAYYDAMARFLVWVTAKQGHDISAYLRASKACLVAKLRLARQRSKERAGKCEGRKSWAEINPELVKEAKRLRRRSPKGHQRSLREVAAELAKLGYVNERGVRFSASSVQSMLA